MRLSFDTSISEQYNSPAQKIRVMSESWLGDNMYCPNCGNPRISHLTNNSPVADFQCDNCGEIYELKSKNVNLGKKIADGAYSTMIERITSDSNPDLFLLQYSDSFSVTGLLLIPRFFFVPEIIEKRKPLDETARRHGWVGCNILFGDIPEQGRISVIQNSRILDCQDVIQNYDQIKKLRTKSIESRGWLLDVLNCVNEIHKTEFTLSDVYAYVEVLQKKHIRVPKIPGYNDTHNIRHSVSKLKMMGFGQIEEFDYIC